MPFAIGDLKTVRAIQNIPDLLKEVVGHHFAEAKKLRLVMDKVYSPEEVRRIIRNTPAG